MYYFSEKVSIVIDTTVGNVHHLDVVIIITTLDSSSLKYTV